MQDLDRQLGGLNSGPKSDHSMLRHACMMGIVVLMEACNGASQVKLMSHLFENYTALARPVINDSSPVPVSIAFQLRSLADVSQLDGRVVANAWCNLIWTDDNLKWAPAEW